MTTNGATLIEEAQKWDQFFVTGDVNQKDKIDFYDKNAASYDTCKFDLDRHKLT